MASLGELLGEYLFGMPQDAEVVEGTRGNVLPGAKYRLPDGTERWGVAAPQGLADALLGLGAAGGRVQDPNAPQGYVSQETLRRGGEGLAGSATLGSFATRAPAGALRSGLSRDEWKKRLPKREQDYIDTREYERALMAPYREGVSSRTTPVDAELPPVGTWRRSPSNLLYGREIEELINVPIKDLIAKELVEGKLDPTKRGDDVTYGNWLAEGKRAPPIDVLQRPDGSLVVVDGHRRLLAAQNAGRDNIEAWVSYDMPYGKVDSNGNPMTTSLTYELANDPTLAANSRNSQAAGLAMELARNQGRDLDPSQAARLARAREMGFGDEVFYHGTTKDVSPGFDPARFGSNTGARDAGHGVYMTDKPAATKYFGGYGESMNPKYAEFLDRTSGMRNEYEIGDVTRELFGKDAIDYHNKQRPKMSYETVMGWEDGSNVMPLRVRGDLKEIDGTTYNPQAFEKAIQEAKAEGWSGVRIKGIKDDFEAPVRHDQVVVFDPSNIRSVNAMFDPAKSDSANLLAANSRNSQAAGLAMELARNQGRDLDPSIATRAPAGALRSGLSRNEVREIDPTRDYFHGTHRKFDKFKSERAWFSPNEDIARDYGPNIKRGRLSPQNPLVHDVAGERGFNWRPLVEDAIEKGHDAVILRNMYDRGSPDLQDQIVILDKAAIADLKANPLAGAIVPQFNAPRPQGPTISDMGGRPIPPEEEAQRQALIRYLEGGM